MKICKPAFLLYQLYHHEKPACFQYVKWYSNYLSIYTISKPTKPKSARKTEIGTGGVVTVPPILATVPQLQARASRGIDGRWYSWDGKNRIFSFFIFGGVFRRAFPYLAIERSAKEAAF